MGWQKKIKKKNKKEKKKEEDGVEGRRRGIKKKEPRIINAKA